LKAAVGSIGLHAYIRHIWVWPETPGVTGAPLDPARLDPVVEFLIHDLDRTVYMGIGHTQLMRDQFHQEVDPLDKRCAIGYRTGRR
jgi:hypothetical protein